MRHAFPRAAIPRCRQGVSQTGRSPWQSSMTDARQCHAGRCSAKWLTVSNVLCLGCRDGARAAHRALGLVQARRQSALALYRYPNTPNSAMRPQLGFKRATRHSRPRHSGVPSPVCSTSSCLEGPSAQRHLAAQVGASGLQCPRRSSTSGDSSRPAVFSGTRRLRQSELPRDEACDPWRPSGFACSKSSPPLGGAVPTLSEPSRGSSCSPCAVERLACPDARAKLSSVAN